MAFEGYLEYDGVEIVNVGRTAALARTLGVTGVRVSRLTIDTLLTRLLEGPGFGEGGFGEGGFGGDDLEGTWSDITEAPWYDDNYPASAEFAGLLPLSVQGLDDSSAQSEVTEYVGSGGNTGHQRNGTQSIVCNFIFVGSTERGVEFGLRWINRVFQDAGNRAKCAGAALYYTRHLSDDAEMVHRRDVAMTRGASITRKRRSRCSTAWWVTFTLTDGGGFEYGTPVDKITSLGQVGPATGPGVTNGGGSLTAVQVDCAAYDYSPIYDPLYPALVAPPTAPNFLPPGWDIETGMGFERRWCRTSSLAPLSLMVVPQIIVSSTAEARMIRVSIFPGDAETTDQCGALFSVVVSYLPADLDLYIDGESQSAYFWDGASPTVRRADSLIYSPTADPVEWASFNDLPYGTFLVTLDAMETAPDAGTYQGGGNVRVALSLTPKSD